ncbi:non-heme iron oxygenase ferredoxin subunit [Alicyclobacillus dauci]|uniref:Non-heme iron oxygenase ferredoxin subunit n=1 Tax=Alicyclobacillus dauci TaxID=1475485 RepID=A0ABY6YYV2_9BACL|nr:non-heme iron oxygenase ferredoxin subunit [Alicyclobacillus dauci]WAH35817.1 non-heme iron oxygenase ferredoxin subunit [Alicyclobacillus dauci]
MQEVVAWVKVATASALAVGEMMQVEVEDEDIAVYHLEDGFYATSDVCTHASQSLSHGTLSGHIVACPKHGGKFDVRTGQATAFPCVIPLSTFDVEVRGDEVWLNYEDE